MRHALRWFSFVSAFALASASCGPGAELEQAEEAVGARPSFAPRGDLTIFAIDVGHGDATLVLGPEDRRGHRISMLLDAGKLRADGGRIVNEVLDEAGVGQIDYVVATHYDADHIGGFVHVLGSESVLWDDTDCTPSRHAVRGAIIDVGDWRATSRTIRQYLDCVQVTAASGVEHVVVRGGDNLGRTFSLGGGYEAVIVAGDGYVIDRPERVRYVNTPNESSVAVWIRGPEDFDFLVTGDLVGRRHGSENALAEPVLGEALAARGVDLEILRVGHHGADNATSPELLASLRPELAVISASGQNNFGHPGCGTYEALADLPVERLVQTQPAPSPCPDESRIQTEVADGTIGIFVEGGRYEVMSVGAYSGATGRETRNFSFACSVHAGCFGASEEVAPRPGDVFISEIMANPAARADRVGEWFELTAADPAVTFDLTGCWLRDDGRDGVVLPEGARVPAGEAITFARSDEPGFTPTYVYRGGLTLANTEDELELVCDGEVIDRVAYGRGFSVRAGASMSLDPNLGDAAHNDDPAAWCLGRLEYSGDLGTPNGPNPPCP